MRTNSAVYYFNKWKTTVNRVLFYFNLTYFMEIRGTFILRKEP